MNWLRRCTPLLRGTPCSPAGQTGAAAGQVKPCSEMSSQLVPWQRVLLISVTVPVYHYLIRLKRT